MANLVFNIAKGRVGEFFFRVDNNDPTNSAIVAVVLKESGLASDATLVDLDWLNDILAGTSDEATNSGYARSTLTDSTGTGGWSSTGLGGIATPAPTDASDLFDYDLPDLSYTSVAGAGGATDNWRKLLICYDSDTTTGTDANIMPLLMHDLSVNPDGSNITLQVPTTGIYRAS